MDPAGPATAVTAAPDVLRPAPAPRQRGRLRIRLFVVAGVLLAAITVLAFAGLQGSLVYYKTTSELAADPGLAGHRVRLGGLVVEGSVRHTTGGVRFELTDGVHELPVVNTGEPRGVFQAGQGAVVEGLLGKDGVFRSDVLLVKHSNQYEPPAGGTGRPQEDRG